MSKGLTPSQTIGPFYWGTLVNTYRADLAPPVRQQLVASNRAGNHLVDIFRRLVLAVNFLILPVAEFGYHQAGMPGNRSELIGSGACCSGSLVDGCGAERLGEHGPSPWGAANG